MNTHIEKAMELRNDTPMVSNCAQTVMKVYAEEMGMTEAQAASIGCNFGGGMKCGGVCGAITSGLMVLGAKGIDNPALIGEYRRKMAEKHEGMIECASLLKANVERGGTKKEHCDNMIRESIELIDQMTR